MKLQKPHGEEPADKAATPHERQRLIKMLMQPHFVAAQPDEYGDYRAVVPMPDATWTCFRLLRKVERERTEWYNNNDLVKLFQNHKRRYVIEKLRSWADKPKKPRTAITKENPYDSRYDTKVKLKPTPVPPLMPHDRFSIQRERIAKWEQDIAELEDTMLAPAKLRALADELEIEVRQQEEEAARIKREKEEMWASFWRGKYGGDEPDPLGDVLNLPSDATPEQIRTRYRELVKKLHPDANRGDDAAVGLLRQVNAAMEDLRTAGKA